MSCMCVWDFILLWTQSNWLGFPGSSRWRRKFEYWSILFCGQLMGWNPHTATELGLGLRCPALLRTSSLTAVLLLWHLNKSDSCLYTALFTPCAVMYGVDLLCYMYYSIDGVEYCLMKVHQQASWCWGYSIHSKHRLFFYFEQLCSSIGFTVDRAMLVNVYKIDLRILLCSFLGLIGYVPKFGVSRHSLNIQIWNIKSLQDYCL